CSAAGLGGADLEAAAARVARFRADAAARAKPAGAGDGEGAAPAAGGLAAIRAAVDALGPAAKPKAASAGPAAIRDLSEVAGDWGLPDAVARRLLPSLTVSSGAATVDPVLADRTVLLALLGSDERVDDYVRRREAGFGDKDSALALLPVPSRDFVAFDDVPAVRAVARVRVANRYERRYEFVLAPPASTPPVAAPDAGDGAGGRSAAPVVVSWRVLP
ncbi:hypothetical protein, partial [Lichenibacterium dinghuense]|uniref:hypothetical protein n=1 Tax=Lichenibacterium dinghuense TaxID=2895977 RepID=UPI001F3AA5E6